MAVTKKIQQILPYIGAKIKNSDVFPVASLTSVNGYATYSVSGIQITNYVIDQLKTAPLIIPSISCTDIKSINLSANNSYINNLTSLNLNSENINAINISSNSLSTVNLSSNQIYTNSISSISLLADTVTVTSLSSNSLTASSIVTDNVFLNGLAATSKISFLLNHIGSSTETIYILPNLFNSLEVLIQVYSLDVDGDAFKTDFVIVNAENTLDNIILTILHPTDTDFKVIMVG